MFGRLEFNKHGDRQIEGGVMRRRRMRGMSRTTESEKQPSIDR